MAKITNVDRSRRIERELAQLIATFPDEQLGVRDEILDCFVRVVGDADAVVVERAVDDFLMARVPGYHLTTLPTAPQLAQHIRDLQYDAEAEAFDFGKAAAPTFQELSTEKTEPEPESVLEGVAWQSPDGARRLLSIEGGLSNHDEPGNAA